MNVPAKDKMLYFAATADAAICFKASELRGMHMLTDDVITFQFSNVATLTNGSPNANATISISSEKQKEVMEAISNELAFGNNAFVVIADQVNSAFFNSDITGCTGVTFDNVG
tara:strand:- start:9992 stop:10330 length:339 start_codon:yes stop_codon:yes gene_type:complete